MSSNSLPFTVKHVKQFAIGPNSLLRQTNVVNLACRVERQVCQPAFVAVLAQRKTQGFGRHGTHTYHRVDEPGSFHTLWSGDRSEVKTSD